MSGVDPRRIRQINDQQYTKGPVIYWMNRDQRIIDNWAFSYARELAILYKTSLIIVFNFDPNFLGGTLRQVDFKIRGLQEVENFLRDHGIPMHVVCGSSTEKDIVKFCAQYKCGALVTDFSPLSIQRQWVNYVSSEVSIPMYVVDAHNIVPCQFVSTKQEVGARTLRPKIHRVFKEFIESAPNRYANPFQVIKPQPIDWDALYSKLQYDDSVKPVTWIMPGYAAAQKMLNHFIETKLSHYDTHRNNPSFDGQSNLSPYIHYGHISAAAIARAVLDAHVPHASKEAFIEELVVRRELSDNFCWYNKDYDNPRGYPTWAIQSLQQHVSDERKHIYDQDQFEQALTHDDLWNAAQNEMVYTGKMHGYMRMYWAKKILEWTPSVEIAHTIARYLNDKYFLDGRDPNGYCGIAWSLGGVHDRPWFDRPVFGVIRYMNRAGCERKFDVKAYIERIATLQNKCQQS